MISSLSKEFGVPEVQSDSGKAATMHLKENCEKMDKKISDDNKKASDNYNLISDNETVVNVPHASRVWTPIDNHNERYLIEKKVRESCKKDFMTQNLEEIHEESEKSKIRKPFKPFVIYDGPAFNYSSQALNSTELAINNFREFVKEVFYSLKFF